MQVLAGKYRRKHLLSSESPKVRPTARRLRESLFDTLGARVNGAHFLDLCAGSGAVGIEALSRGASHTTFVEHSRKMCSFLKTNLEICGVPCDEAAIVESDCAAYLKDFSADDREAFDIAYFDPPYSTDYSPVLSLFANNEVVRRDVGLLVVEHKREKYLPQKLGRLLRLDVLRQGDSCLSFYAARGVEASSLKRP